MGIMKKPKTKKSTVTTASKKFARSKNTARNPVSKLANKRSKLKRSPHKVKRNCASDPVFKRVSVLRDLCRKRRSNSVTDNAETMNTPFLFGGAQAAHVSVRHQKKFRRKKQRKRGNVGRKSKHAKQSTLRKSPHSPTSIHFTGKKKSSVKKIRNKKTVASVKRSTIARPGNTTEGSMETAKVRTVMKNLRDTENNIRKHPDIKFPIASIVGNYSLTPALSRKE